MMNMEQLIGQLLLADSEVIKKATFELQERLKNPETVLSLCEVLSSSQNVQVRQYAAVLLRRRLSKLKYWNLVPPEHQQLIQSGTSKLLIQEQEKHVKSSIAQLLGVLFKHAYTKSDPWAKEVLNFIFQYCNSPDPTESELGTSVFSTFTDICPDQFLPHMPQICEMFSNVLSTNEANGNLATISVYNTMVGMGNMIPFIVNNPAENSYQAAIPQILKVLQAFSIHDVDKFIIAFEILENIADYLPKLLSSTITILISFCLELANHPQIDAKVKTRVVTFLGWTVKLKKKVIIKQKLIEPIIQVIFNLMTTAPELDDEDDEEYFVGDAEETSPMTAATQTMDLLALHIPPEKLVLPLFVLLEPALKGSEPLPRKAAYVALAVIAEGCSEYLCERFLVPMVDYVKIGIRDGNPVVRNAALFALGQFSEHLQPDIAKHSGDILPILFDFLHELCQQLKNGGTEPKHIDRLFYALETFCENLEDDLIPHLPILMERLFEAMNPNNSVHLRELTINAISSTATAAKENMLPYFNPLIEGLKVYLVKSDDENISALTPNAIDALASLARSIGKNNFQPLTADTMNFSMQLLTTSDDPDERRSIYNLLSALAEILNNDIAPVLPQIVTKMLETLNNTDEVIKGYKYDQDPADTNNVADEIDIENSEGEDDDDDDDDFAVENAFLDEKEEAVLALKSFAEYSCPSFIPYLQSSFEAAFKLLDHAQEDMRSSAIAAVSKFIIAWHGAGNVDVAKTNVCLVVPKLGEIIKNDEECQVAMSALEACTELLQEMKGDALCTDDVKKIMFQSVVDVFSSKVACQFNEPVDGDDEEVESEYDEALVERAGDVLPQFGAALNPAEFAYYFGQILPILVTKIRKSQGNEDLETQLSFAFGALSDCFKPLDSFSGNWFNDLLPIMLSGTADQCDQVRHNAVFGLGELYLHSGEKSYAEFPRALQALSTLVASEQHPGVLDNICGALARLIMTNSQLVPLEQVLPVFVQYLPLREDYDENLTIFKCFRMLYVQGSNALVSIMEKVIATSCHVIMKNEFKSEETQENISWLLTECRQKFPEKFVTVAASDPAINEFIQQHFKI